MNGLDLFSGIGGIALALKPWVRTVAYCEQDRYAQGVLLSRMRDGSLDRAPIWNDVRTLSLEQFSEPIDIISGGFPCQDISVAGRGVGLEGDRSGLFFEIVRLCSDLRPRFVFLENVPAITVRGLERVCLELTAIGYDCRWTIVSAAELGAPHLRKRWFLLAHANGNASGNERQALERVKAEMGPRSEADTRDDGAKEPLADSDRLRESSGAEGGDRARNRVIDGRETVADAQGVGWREGRTESAGFEGRSSATGGGPSMADAVRAGRNGTRAKRSEETNRTGPFGEFARPSWWAAEPDMGRVAHGIPFRVDRLRCLGNSVVPLQAREAFKRLIGIGG